MAGEQISIETLPPGPSPIQSAPTPPMDEQAVRAAVMQAESKGADVVEVPAQTSAPQAKPTSEIPEKFKKVDGTVDVEKLLDSTKQLDAAIDKKELTIDEMLADYKEKEKRFRNLPSNPEQIQRMAQAPAIAPQAPPPMMAPADLHAQLNAEFQRDPVGTMVDLVKAVTQNQQQPVVQFIEHLQEQQRDNGIKNNIAQIASEDPRVLQPELYTEIMKELDNDPAYWHLRNPHLAAWSVVKGRLRLGEVQIPAQPSRTATPILGGGTPPPVPSSASGQVSPQTLLAAMGQIKTPDERQRVEAELRRMTVSAGL